MNRSLAWLGVWWACLAACSTPEANTPASPSPAPLPSASSAAPASPPQPVPSAVSPEQLEAWMLACDGAALAAVGPQAIAASTPGTDVPSAHLLAHWESVRAFGRDGTLDSAAADSVAKRIAMQLGAPVPAWWADQLRSAVRRDEREPPFYDGKMAPDADRRGPWHTEHGVRRRGGPLSPLAIQENRALTYDFSMGRATLAKTIEPGNMVEFDRPHAGSTIYFAAFEPGMGGFPFPLVAAAANGTQTWSTTVCGPNRSVLGGVGHLLVEVRVLEDAPSAGHTRKMQAAAPPRGVAVFTAESHGVALEVFDAKTGKRTFAWSSDLWFSRTSPVAASP